MQAEREENQNKTNSQTNNALAKNTKTEKNTTNSIKNITEKTEHWATRYQSKTGIISGAPEGETNPV